MDGNFSRVITEYCMLMRMYRINLSGASFFECGGYIFLTRVGVSHKITYLSGINTYKVIFGNVRIKLTCEPV